MPLPIIPYLLESGPTDPVSLLRRQLTEPFPVHGHDYFELELVVSGKGRQWLNGEELFMEPGCLYLLSPADYHRVEPEPVLELYSFHFTPEYAAGLGFSLAQEARNTRISLEETAAHAAKLLSLTEPSAAGQAYHVQELLIPLLPLLLRLLREGRSRRLSKPEQRFQAGLKYVQAHHAEPGLRLEDAARACGLSVCYFSALFSQAVGYRFTDYVTECRLRHACALLSSSPVSVTEAAYESGFPPCPISSAASKAGSAVRQAVTGSRRRRRCPAAVRILRFFLFHCPRATQNQRRASHDSRDCQGPRFFAAEVPSRHGGRPFHRP